MKHYVEKTTTDKLEDVLNNLAERGYPVLEIQWTGGRDWVLIFGPSKDDPWHESNWGAGKPGLLPQGLCNVFPKGSLAVPCLYQRDHTGRHHFEPLNSDELPPAEVERGTVIDA